MGTGLVDAAPEVFRTASEVLGADVARLCMEGTSGDADLRTTKWAQPAVLTCGVAAFRVLVGRGETFRAAAGHSVGEYAALVSTGALDLTDALQVIGERAEATDDAGRAIPGGMAAVMRIDREIVERVCSENGTALAADNGPGQYVVAGPLDALELTIAAAQEAGATTRHLDVAAAFHSPVMAPAIARLSAALDKITIREPIIEFWSSTTARALRTPAEIRNALLDQLTSPVRWRETMSGLAKRFGSRFYDLGPGKVVAGLVRRIVQGAEIRIASDVLVEGAS
jgi:[acyl-carrier-protein] S-malonyltransferase